MGGNENKQMTLFSQVPIEQRVSANYPLLELREMVGAAFDQLHDLFLELYSHKGSPSVPKLVTKADDLRNFL